MLARMKVMEMTVVVALTVRTERCCMLWLIHWLHWTAGVRLPAVIASHAHQHAPLPVAPIPRGRGDQHQRLGQRLGQRQEQGHEQWQDQDCQQGQAPGYVQCHGPCRRPFRPRPRLLPLHRCRRRHSAQRKAAADAAQSSCHGCIRTMEQATAAAVTVAFCRQP